MTLALLSFHKDCFSTHARTHGLCVHVCVWCVYTCVVVHGCVYVHSCKCVWGPEVDVSLLLFLFLRLNLELINWTRLAGSAPEIPLFLPLTLHRFIPQVLGIKHRSPCLHGKPFTEWVTLWLPILCFLMLI